MLRVRLSAIDIIYKVDRPRGRLIRLVDDLIDVSGFGGFIIFDTLKRLDVFRRVHSLDMICQSNPETGSQLSILW